jgi:hypothetical protein
MNLDLEDFVSTPQDWQKWLRGIVDGERTERPTREDLICLFANLMEAAGTAEYQQDESRIK